MPDGPIDREVTFTLHAEQLAFTGVDHRRIVEPGQVTLSVGTSSADRPLSAGLALTGRVIDRSVRQHYLTKSCVS